MNKEQMSHKDFEREVLIREMYFHCDYEDSVARTIPEGGTVRFFIRQSGIREYEVNQNSGIAMQVSCNPVEITREEYVNF